MTPPVLVGVKDLFFRSKIEETARQLGIKITFLNPKELTTALATAKPVTIIVDLEDQAEDLLKAVRALPKQARKSFLIGYLSHVRTDLRDAALKAGFDLVLPRSAFALKLPSILNGEFER